VKKHNFSTISIRRQGLRPDRELARKWDDDRARKQVHIHEPTYFDYGFIHGSVQTINGTVTGGTFVTGSSNSERDREKDLNNEIESFFQGPSERQPSNLFGGVEYDVSNETDNKKGEVIEIIPKHKRDESLQHVIEQEVLLEGVKLQTPQKRENEIEKVEESDMEFGPELKKIKPNKSDERESVVSHDSQSQAQTPERQFSPSTSVPEVTDDVFEPQPMGWEFDEPKPTWLEKVISRQKFLISQTDPSARYESSLDPIWWRIIDTSDLKIHQNF